MITTTHVTTSLWYEQALAGLRPAIHESTLPQPGLYKRRLEPRSKVWLPARIWWSEHRLDDTGELAGDVEYRCEVAGYARDCFREWWSLSKNPIDAAEYWRLMDATYPPEAVTLVDKWMDEIA